jgi:hypothetical protein
VNVIPDEEKQSGDVDQQLWSTGDKSSKCGPVGRWYLSLLGPGSFGAL